MRLLPAISREQMAAADRLMVGEYRTGVQLMMEHAGLNLARLALSLSRESGAFSVVAGPGNNGGGGIVAARRLAGWGIDVKIYLPRGAGSLRPLPAEQLARARAFGVPVIEGLPPDDDEACCIDAYFGYGFDPGASDDNKDVFDSLSSRFNVTCLDLPSGMDADTGHSYSHIKPRATLTLAFVKTGLLKAQQIHVGDLYIADIGLPVDLFRDRLGIKWQEPFDPEALDDLAAAFRQGSILRVRSSIVPDPVTPAWWIDSPAGVLPAG
ncbi:NAD(P)H-hydrate epimerase [Dehalogenimonas sp. THU2]|uniref:NAD(P)H-hydrate epimerase n=1 Tax=Dehalogenimonas sp. THU2 TaxID=3151121 RepID=UPI003218CF89